MYVSFLNLESIYQVWNIKIILLLIKKVTIFTEYLDFKTIFLKKLNTKLPKYLGNNKYVINSENSKQLSYISVNNLWLVELKTFKTYIKTNLTNSFI